VVVVEVRETCVCEVEKVVFSGNVMFEPLSIRYKRVSGITLFILNGLEHRSFPGNNFN